MPDSFLEKILRTKQEELAHFTMPTYSRTSKTVRSLKQALSTPNHALGLIAEVKQASPSKGMFREIRNPGDLVASYTRAGADAVSVLTDRTYFHGSLERLRAIRRRTELPILRKDFIIDPRQIEEAYRAGADAVLLIVAALEPSRLLELHAAASELGLECLIEVHNAREAEALIGTLTPELIGINNRDLTTFQTTLQTTAALRPLLPEDALIVSESGVHHEEDVSFLARQHVQAALVGEALITTDAPEQKIAELFGEVQLHAADA
ncbi:MAG: indole-3-glycerol phosphate synthase TrpC [Sporolactobacillus sp.]